MLILIFITSLIVLSLNLNARYSRVDSMKSYTNRYIKKHRLCFWYNSIEESTKDGRATVGIKKGWVGEEYKGSST